MNSFMRTSPIGSRSGTTSIISSSAMHQHSTRWKDLHGSAVRGPKSFYLFSPVPWSHLSFRRKFSVGWPFVRLFRPLPGRMIAPWLAWYSHIIVYGRSTVHTRAFKKQSREVNSTNLAHYPKSQTEYGRYERMETWAADSLPHLIKGRKEKLLEDLSDTKISSLSFLMRIRYWEYAISRETKWENCCLIVWLLVP